MSPRSYCHGRTVLRGPSSCIAERALILRALRDSILAINMSNPAPQKDSCAEIAAMLLLPLSVKRVAPPSQQVADDVKRGRPDDAEKSELALLSLPQWPPNS